jgi:CRP-like cAMP-binding protein
MRARRLLDDSPVFRCLLDEERDQLARVSEAVRYDPGDTIVEEGEFSWRFFAIDDGDAAVFHDGVKVASLGPGDFFGEMGVLPHNQLAWGRRRATVIAASRVTAVAIPGAELRSVVDEVPELREALTEAAAARAVE